MDTTQDIDHGHENNAGNGGGDGVGYGDVTSRAIGGTSDGEISCGDIDGIGGTSHNGPMPLEPTSPMANHRVPPFLIKLYLMVDDQATNSIISWSSSRITFIILDQPRFISKILPCYFKTSRFVNFLVQLNTYGFKKEWDRLEFKHEDFQQGKVNLLKNIKRKKQQQSNAINKPCVPISGLKAAFSKARQDHKHISNQIKSFKCVIEQSLLEVQTTMEAMINKLPFTFTETVGQKRSYLDHIDMGTHFLDIQKDFESIGYQFEGLGSDCSKTLTDLKQKVINGSNGVGDGCRIPQFLHKLYTMVENKEIDDHISWKLPCRESFIVWDINNFATHVLPMYFKHKNFASFNSQLNIYGFKKVSWEKHEYANEWFRGGRYDLLVNITRRSKSLRAITCSTTEIEMFNNRLKTIQQDQEHKIALLSKYEEQIKSSVNEFKKTVVKIADTVEQMMQKSNENVKKSKLGIETNIRGDATGNETRQEPEVNELETTSSEKNYFEGKCFFQDLEIDPEVVDKIMKEDPWFD